MRSKAAFIVGTGLGYVLGTRAGRQRFETIKGWSRRAWQSPQVQARVSELEGKAADFAKTEAAALKGRVTESIRTAVGSSKGVASSDPVERYATAPVGRTPDAGPQGAAYTPPSASGNGTSQA